MQDFRNLKVWQHAHELALAVYAATSKMPQEERFGLTSQIAVARCRSPLTSSKDQAVV